jgi:hypothetical protein
MNNPWVWIDRPLKTMAHIRSGDMTLCGINLRDQRTSGHGETVRICQKVPQELDQCPKCRTWGNPTT